MREKELQPCDDSDDCERGSRCLPLGRSSESYCLRTQSTHGGRPASVVADNDNTVTLIGGGLGTCIISSAKGLTFSLYLSVCLSVCLSQVVGEFSLSLWES